MSDVDALFAGMKGAPIFGSGTYLAPGLFEVESKKMFLKNRMKDGVTLFIFEFAIVASAGEGVSPHPKHAPGSTGSWTTKIAGLTANSSWGEIKSLAFSLLGQDPKSVAATDEKSHALVTLLVKAVCGSPTAGAELAAMGFPSAEALLIGKRVRLETSQIKIKSTGGDFTKHMWSPVPAGGAL